MGIIFQYTQAKKYAAADLDSLAVN